MDSIGADLFAVLSSLSAAVVVFWSGAQGWIGNKATHFAFYCNDPCCGPDAAHPETAMCGVLFARMSVAG